MEKIYHIYVKENCIYHSLKEEEFKVTWNTLNKLVGLMRTEYSEKDLSYEELTLNRKEILDSSH